MISIVHRIYKENKPECGHIKQMENIFPTGIKKISEKYRQSKSIKNPGISMPEMSPCGSTTDGL
jgi:hypothetical protein